MNTPATICQLWTAYDAVYTIGAQLAVWERDEPVAPEALRAWARDRGVKVVERQLSEGFDNHAASVLCVETRSYHEINVYLRVRP